MVSSHNGVLVTLSILIAVAASYTALDIAQRVRESSTRISRTAWLAAAALCMGGGIWSMHFVAMLAYTMPGIVISYDPLLTALSLLIAILVTGGGFALVSRREESGLALCLGGLFMGAGIVAMHYIGMSAMRMPAHMTYSLTWVVVSILIALGAAVAALWLAFRGSRTLHQGGRSRCDGICDFGHAFCRNEGGTSSRKRGTGGAGIEHVQPRRPGSGHRFGHLDDPSCRCCRRHVRSSFCRTRPKRSPVTARG